jgi:hypothetical protein
VITVAQYNVLAVLASQRSGSLPCGYAIALVGRVLQDVRLAHPSRHVRARCGAA